MAALRKFIKYGIRIAATAGETPGVLVVDPSEDDDSGVGVEPEEQPETPSNFGATPMSKNVIPCRNRYPGATQCRP